MHRQANASEPYSDSHQAPAEDGERNEMNAVLLSGPAPAKPALIVAGMDHLPAAKRLADRHKYELGFINRTILQKAIESQSLVLAQGSRLDSSG